MEATNPVTLLKDQRPYIDIEGIGPRLKITYDWLKANGQVTSEPELAKGIGVSRSTYQRWVADYLPETPKIHVFAIDSLMRNYSVRGRCVDPWWVISGATHQTGMERVRDESIPLSERFALAISLSNEYADLAREFAKQAHW